VPLRLHLSVSLLLLVLSLGRGALGAEVQVRADDGCAEPGPIVDEVEQIIGRPLVSIPGVAFHVEITHAGPRSWRLRLDTEETGGSAGAGAVSGPPRATRELNGASCGELASAAAVAIALSIQTAEAEKTPPAAPEPPIAPPPPAAPAAVRPVVDVAPPPVRVSAALLAVGDVGALPHVAAGGELNVALQRGRFGAIALVSGFPPQQTSVTPLTGGQFTLVFGGLLACANRPRTSATAEICAGGELGRIVGEGTGATHPRVGGALWAAGRAEVGVAVPISSDWAFVAQAAAVFPFVRPTFQINGMAAGYQPAVVSGRVGAGLQLAF